MSAAVDGLVYLGRSHFGVELDADRAVERAAGLGIACSIAVPMHPTGANFSVANRALAQSVARSAGRLAWLARVDPWTGPAALEELGDAVARGARGLFLHPAEERFRINDRSIDPLFDLAGDLGVPVVVATGTHLLSEPVQLADVAARHASTSFVLTNGGQLNISGLAQFDAELALRNENVVVQTSGMYREDFLERVVAVYGPDRLMFASAAPVFDERYELQRVRLARFSESERGLILGGTAARLFGVEAAS